jgi:hypothetical protein
MSPAVRAYLVTALWSSTGDDGAPLDATYCVEDFAPEACAKATVEISEFRHAMGDTLETAMHECGHGIDKAMHDLWLTSRRHGAGFWDGDWGNHGGPLTAAAHKLPEESPYIGDDGLIYL